MLGIWSHCKTVLDELVLTLATPFTPEQTRMKNVRVTLRYMYMDIPERSPVKLKGGLISPVMLPGVMT